MCWLYIGTFGCFIGYSAGFPLLTKTQFPDVNSLQFVFLGPLVGALIALGHRLGRRQVRRRARHLLGLHRHDRRRSLGVIFFLGIKDQPGAFWGFFACFMVLFFFTGVGNSSTFQMIPVIMGREMAALMPGARTPRRGSGRRKGIRRDHRLHLGDRRLRRLLHSQVLRLLDLDHRLARGRALGVPRLLRDLPRADLLYYTRPGVCCTRWSTAATRAELTPAPAE